MILPADFGVPPLPYAVGLAVALAATAGALYFRQPQVNARVVSALAPWMASGGALYALYQAETIPADIAPLFGSPAVYGTVGVLAGLVWAAVADRPSDSWELSGAPAFLAVSGGVLLAGVLLVAAIGPTPRAVGTTPLVSGSILLASVLVAGGVWVALSRFVAVSATGWLGAVTVFGHTLDGISTAIGFDHLGFGEQTPLSRILLEVGQGLPIADVLGGGWLFVLIKVALGAAVVVLFEGYIREEPMEGSLLLGLIAAVGLGPGFHNLVLFVIL